MIILTKGNECYQSRSCLRVFQLVILSTFDFRCHIITDSYLVNETVVCYKIFRPTLVQYSNKFT
jgi:hypothetical protein